MLAVIIFAAFMNPEINCLSIINNFIRGVTARSFFEMNQIYPKKFIEITLTKSCPIGDQAEAFMENLSESSIQWLNLSNIPL